VLDRQTRNMYECQTLKHIFDLKCRCYTCEEFYYTTFSSDQYLAKKVSLVVKLFSIAMSIQFQTLDKPN